MKFSAILAAVALAAVSQVAYAAPAELETRDVWDPRMTYPTKGTVWESGKTYTVKWSVRHSLSRPPVKPDANRLGRRRTHR